MAVGITLAAVIVGALLFSVGLLTRAGFLVGLGMLSLAGAFLYAVAVPGDHVEEYEVAETTHPTEVEATH